MNNKDKNQYPFWKRININSGTIPDFKTNSFTHTAKFISDDVEINESVKSKFKIDSDFNFTEQISYGISKKHNEVNFNEAGCGYSIVVKKNVKILSPIIINVQIHNENSKLIDKNFIRMGENSEATIILDYRSNSINSIYHNGSTKIIAENSSKLNVIKLQNFNSKSHHLYSMASKIDSFAEVNYTSIDLGSGVSVSSYAVALFGQSSHANIKAAYLGDGDRKIDIGFNIYHYAKESVSSLEAYGALLDSSRKVFRDNIYFENGCSKSKGSEKESVILLSNNAKADSIPALFCKEEDVAGEHSASAGQISSEKLFYLMSRGLSESEAKKLIVSSSLEPIILGIPDELIQSDVRKEIERRFMNELQ